MIETYIAGLLITNSILILWFFSPLPNSIGKYFLKKQNIYTLDHLMDILAVKSDFLSTLLSCWICLSFWISLFVGICLMLFCQLPMYFPILTFLTYPSITYLLKQLYH